MRFEFNVNLKKVRHISFRKESKIKKEPSLRQSLILAYQLQQVFNKGETKSLKQVASWLNISYSRISQIMNLLFLASSIQEEILLCDSKTIQNLTEYGIRKISTEIDWVKQRISWQRSTRNN